MFQKSHARPKIWVNFRRIERAGDTKLARVMWPPMGYRSVFGRIGWGLAALALATSAAAQARGGTEPTRRHRQHLHHRAAAASEPAGEWTAARSELIIS